jgi:hypothetical protein
MKEYNIENYIIYKNINDIYNKLLDLDLYIDNTKNVFNIKKYQQGEWVVDKNKKRIDVMDIEIDDLPEIIKINFFKGSNIISFKNIITILEDTDNVKYIKSKIIFTNINYNNIILKKIINYTSNKIINLKNKTKIIKLNDNISVFNTKSKINIHLPNPYNLLIGEFIYIICKKIIDLTIENLLIC